ncbi:unnamed protein product [Darwinula stevensoni]|uniref:Uncharacterized protein n=1 Tax=Darwinula stevensoni TaxID=69355 RepID=A0A7R8WYH4_9CRUS|nr:unnamed protein product [Darwinula stevensoni]CAG0879391.1 unnamed protein product [Darwinula stevensoni]
MGMVEWRWERRVLLGCVMAFMLVLHQTAAFPPSGDWKWKSMAKKSQGWEELEGIILYTSLGFMLWTYGDPLDIHMKHATDAIMQRLLDIC